MIWIAESTISLGFFVLMQILYKLNWRAGVPAPVINLTTFVMSAFAFFIGAGGMRADLFSSLNFFLVFLSGILIYCGNAASVRGFNRAPNPGYSLAITKSYVMITVIASILFFGGEFAWQKIFGIVLILASQILVIGGNIHKKVDDRPRWIYFSLTAFFSFAALAIAVKYASANLGINQQIFLFWATVISLLFFGAETCFRKISLFDYKRQAGSLFLMGLASGIANVFMWNAFIHAPNMGYVNAINVASMAIIALLAAKLFGDELTKMKSLGIAGVILGVLIIVLN